MVGPDTLGADPDGDLPTAQGELGVAAHPTGPLADALVEGVPPGPVAGGVEATRAEVGDEGDDLIGGMAGQLAGEPGAAAAAATKKKKRRRGY